MEPQTEATTTHPPPSLILLGGNRAITDRTRALRIPSLLVTTKARIKPADYEQADRTLLVEQLDDPLLPQLLASAHQVTPFAACVCLTELGLEPAARITELLGLPGNSLETVSVTRNKALMRERLAKHNISPVAACRCHTVDDALNFAATTGFPIIVKPIDGVGSHNVHLARSPHELATFTEELTATSGSSNVLLEEFLDGPEFSIETFSYHGRHVTLAITAKQIHEDTFIEVGHLTPAPLDDQDATDIRALVAETLDAVGVTDGPAHTEVKLTSHGPRIIETHTRIGGDYISRLVRITTGLDLFEMTITWAAGIAEPLPFGTAKATCGAAIRFLTPPPGRLDAIIGKERLAAAPGVITCEVTRTPGDHIPPLRRSADRSGHIIATAPTAEAAAQICRNAEQTIEIVVTSERA